MTAAEKLVFALKIDLGIMTNAFDSRLITYLQNAQQALQREGVALTESAEDDTLTVQYAAWTWRHRESGEEMPRMIRRALNNRIFSQHMQEG